MPHFDFRGRNTRGELITGTLEGGDTGVIADQLMNTGITPVDIQASQRILGDRAPDWWRNLGRRKATLLELMLFSRQMHTLLKAGVPILRALAGLQESAVNPTMIDVIKDLRQSLDSGRELGLDAPPSGGVLVLLRQPGPGGRADRPARGRVPAAVQPSRVRKGDPRKHPRGGSLPDLRAVRDGGAIVIINLFVIPAFAKVYAGFKAELPFLTKLLIGFSNLMVETWYLQLAALIAAGFAFRA